MITIENLSFQYQDGKGYALRDVNLTVKEGDFIGIIGVSGAGKSTLTYAINGIIPHHYAGDFYEVYITIYFWFEFDIEIQELYSFCNGIGTNRCGGF